MVQEGEEIIHSKTKIILPILSTILISFVCFTEKKTLPKVPLIITRIFFKNGIPSSYERLLPALPLNNSCIFKLGQLENQLRIIEEKYKDNKQELSKETNKIIQEAKLYVNKGEISPEILHKYAKILDDLLNNGFVSKIKGFFSFINIIWMLAIIGLLISVGPFLGFLIKPLGEILIRLWFTLFNNVIYPLYMFLYRNGILKIFGYIFSNQLIFEGMKVNQDYGYFISLTGIAFLCLVLFIELKDLGTDVGNSYLRFYSTLTSINLFSLSIIFYSKLFSLISILILHILFIAKIEKSKLFDRLGFDSDHFLLSMIFSSLVFFFISIFIKTLKISNNITEIYQSPLQIFGTISYFIGIIFISPYDYYRKKLSYIGIQIIFILSFVLLVFIGNIFKAKSLLDTSITFGAIYIFIKIYELYEIFENIWVYIFVTSLCLWYCSLYLYRHPKFIISVFDSD